MAEKRKQKVFVGMSGGVDSSVAAALLLEQGYEVVGVFIKVWQADFLPCNWREERRDAMRAAAHLGIPFLTLDLEKEYKRDVVDYMIREYGAGRVPNPDVMCNKHVKFGAFLDFAKAHGADFIATGHYARIGMREFPISNLQFTKKSNTQNFDKTGNYKLLTGVDKEKDQSYFLWTLTQEQLARTLFPVGFMQKEGVRLLARDFGLPNAGKKDSQGLCFMGKVDMPGFLKHYLKKEAGEVIDEYGNVIGTHEGALFYTIGQRHGFSTKKSSQNEKPHIVISKDLKRNTLTVAHRDLDSLHQTQSEFILESFNDISRDSLLMNSNISARIRYRGELHPISSISFKDPSVIKVNFIRPVEKVPPGQSVVIYSGEECLGGGIIAQTS